MATMDHRLVSLTAPGSMEAEQYQSLRLKLEHLRPGRDARVLAVTSPGARDGKTVTAINLAGTLAREEGARVLLIEADLRRPAIARYLAVDEPAIGLAQLVADPKLTIADAVRLRDTLTFDVILAGPMASRVDEVVRSPRLQALFDDARKRYDYVVLDTPPLGAVSDAAVLARWVDGLLLVVAAHRTPRRQLEEALDLLDGSTVLGIVFNGDDRPLFGYRSRYYRSYFAPPASASSVPARSAGSSPFGSLRS